MRLWKFRFGLETFCLGEVRYSYGRNFLYCLLQFAFKQYLFIWIWMKIFYHNKLKIDMIIHWNLWDITKTRIYSFDPLKPHFYIVKPGFIGVYINFLISAQNHRLWVLVRTASPFWAEIWKLPETFIWKFHFFVVKFSIYLNRRVFVMVFILFIIVTMAVYVLF